MTSRHAHRLAGVRALPLAHYLKALGIHRLVAEQADPTARAHWDDGEFVLDTVLDRRALESFFLERCLPTPVASPWNGGSGFYPKDNREGFDPILHATGHRFATYRQVLEQSLAVVRDRGLEASPKEEEKRGLIEICRGCWPDSAVAWIDAAVVLTDERPVFPPLLGTGGNDGRLEFSSNLMRRWTQLIDANTDAPRPGSADQLRLALFATNASVLEDASIGQFLPASEAGINAWDYVLMIEGSLLFAGASVRRLGRARGASTAPFTVRSVAAGYGSAASGEAESSRGEIWLPLWSAPTTLPVVQSLFGEGRATIGRREANDGVDFARAIAGLGVDRGIDAFERIGFHVRNGLSFFAAPLGRFDVHHDPGVDLLQRVDGWLESVRRVVRSDAAPASLASALRRVEHAMLELARRSSPARFQDVTVALARLDAAVASRKKLVDDPKFQLRPLLLEGPEWLHAIDDGSDELRLALAFGSASYRTSAGPVRFSEHLRRTRRNEKGRLVYDARDEPDYVFRDGRDTVENLIELVRRVSLVLRRDGDSTWNVEAAAPAPLSALMRFAAGELDLAKLEGLLTCVSVMNPEHLRPLDAEPQSGIQPPGVLACIVGAHTSLSPEGRRLPLDPAIAERGAAGDAIRATAAAVRRLRASGLMPSLDHAVDTRDATRRSVAALAFPISPRDAFRVRAQVCRHRAEVTEIPEGAAER